MTRTGLRAVAICARVILITVAVSTTACVHSGTGESTPDPARLLKRDDSLVVMGLSGHWRGIGDVRVYDIAPGAKRIAVIWTGTDRVRGTSELSFDARPGRLYLLDGHIDFRRGVYTAWITDLRTGDVYGRKEIGGANCP